MQTPIWTEEQILLEQYTERAALAVVRGANFTQCLTLNGLQPSMMMITSANQKKLANRVEQFYSGLTKNCTSEKESILQDIHNLEGLITRYHKLLTDPVQPLSTSHLAPQSDTEIELEQPQRPLTKYETSRPDQFIPAFYRILGEAPEEFRNLDIDRQKRMQHLLVDSIEIVPLSPHIYSLLLKWKGVVAQPWDCAPIYKRKAPRNVHSLQDWTDEELELFRRIYPETSQIELYLAFPMKSGVAITQRAYNLQIKRSDGLSRNYVISRSLSLENWKRTCEALNAEQDCEEGQTILSQSNYLAEITESKSMSFWWMLPVMQISNFEVTLTRQKYCKPKADFEKGVTMGTKAETKINNSEVI